MFLVEAEEEDNFVVCGRLGAVLGVQNAANSLGQATGPRLGGALFVWQRNAPYLLSGALLVGVAVVSGWKAVQGQREARIA